eukprot:gene4501-32576_t
MVIPAVCFALLAILGQGPGLASVKSFSGTSIHADGLRDVTPACAASPYCAAMMTFLWSTGGKEVHGRFINDNVIMRYYLDDATEPSLEFFPGAASGSFVNLESLDYYTTIKTPPSSPNDPEYEDWAWCGMDLVDSDTNDGTFQPWMTKWAGKNGAEGNWINNFRIPFYKNVRVTAQIDPSRPTEIFPNASSGLFAIFRGVEGDENTLAGTVQLGEAALNITGGALFLTTIGYRPGKDSRGLDWDGGCYWALTDGDAALEPGKATLVGTGIEDYFNSGFAFGFFAKYFHNDHSGLTHVHGGAGRGTVGQARPDWFSAYRYFDQASDKPTGRTTDRGSPVVIDSYAWVYTWDEPQ